MITKEQFEKLIGKKLIEENGKLIYKGNLDLEGRKDITELPNNFKVLGYLDLCNTGVTKLPKGLEVEKWLCISLTEIEELPEDTKFGSNLYIEGMKKPFSFPEVVNVDGHFDCVHTTIKRMPEEIYVEKSCDFSYSKFDKLPKVMELVSSLFVNNSSIKEMPEGLKEVYDDLNISHTKVTKLNDNLVLYGGLDLSNTLIKDLSEGVIIGGELCLNNINLKDYSNLHKHCSRFRVTEEKYEEIKDTLAKHSKEKTWYNEIVVTFEPNYKGAYLFENENGKYIKADEIFGKIVEQKDNVYLIQIEDWTDSIYLVTDGEGNWVNEYTLEKAKAKADLLTKTSKG